MDYVIHHDLGVLKLIYVINKTVNLTDLNDDEWDFFVVLTETIIFQSTMSSVWCSLNEKRGSKKCFSVFN